MPVAKPNYSYEKRQRELEKKKKKEEKAARKAAGGSEHESNEDGLESVDPTQTPDNAPTDPAQPPSAS